VPQDCRNSRCLYIGHLRDTNRVSEHLVSYLCSPLRVYKSHSFYIPMSSSSTILLSTLYKVYVPPPPLSTHLHKVYICIYSVVAREPGAVLGRVGTRVVVGPNNLTSNLWY